MDDGDQRSEVGGQRSEAKRSGNWECGKRKIKAESKGQGEGRRARDDGRGMMDEGRRSKVGKKEVQKVRRKEGRDQRARIKGKNYKGKRQNLITIV